MIKRNDYEQFNTELENILQKNLNITGKNIEEIKQHTFKKSNVELQGLLVKEANNNIAVPVYTESYYSKYQDGEPIENIAEDITQYVINAFNMRPDLPDFTAEEAKKSIKLVLINENKNQELLKKTPHIRVGGDDSDIVAIPRWYISDEASFIVHNHMASHLNLTGDEIIKIGYENVKNQEYLVKPMEELVKDMMMESGMAEDVAEAMASTGMTDILVITNKMKHEGANAILNDDVLKRAYDMIGGESYIIPSSRHEVIVIPQAIADADQVLDMIHYVNDAEVSIEDYLSDGLLSYDGRRLAMIPADNMQIERNIESQEYNYDIPKMSF